MYFALDHQWRSLREGIATMLSNPEGANPINEPEGNRYHKNWHLAIQEMEIVSKLGILANNQSSSNSATNDENVLMVAVGSEKWIGQDGANYGGKRFNLYKILVLKCAHWTIYSLMQAIADKYNITSFASGPGSVQPWHQDAVQFEHIVFARTYREIVRLSGIDEIHSTANNIQSAKEHLFELTRSREDEHWVLDELLQLVQIYQNQRQLESKELNQRWYVLERNVIDRCEMLANARKLTVGQPVATAIVELLNEFKKLLENCKSNKQCTNTRVESAMNSIVLQNLIKVLADYNANHQKGADQLTLLLKALHRTKRISVDREVFAYDANTYFIWFKIFDQVNVLHRKRDLIFVVLNSLFIEQIWANETFLEESVRKRKRSC